MIVKTKTVMMMETRMKMSMDAEFYRSHTFGDYLGVYEKVHLVGLKNNIKTHLIHFV